MAMKRKRSSKKLWKTHEAKLVLSKGELTQEGLKIIVENQRDINTNIYKALDLIEKKLNPTMKGKRKSSKLHDLIEAIPGPGFPGCAGGEKPGGDG